MLHRHRGEISTLSRRDRGRPVTASSVGIRSSPATRALSPAPSLPTPSLHPSPREHIRRVLRTLRHPDNESPSLRTKRRARTPLAFLAEIPYHSPAAEAKRNHAAIPMTRKAKASPSRSWSIPAGPRAISWIPGLALVLLIATVSRFLHGLLPRSAGAAVGEVIVGVLLGLLIGNVLPLPSSLSPGIGASFRVVLPAAIVLLGARFSFQQIIGIGGKALLMVVVLMTLALAMAHTLGRALGVSRKLATLIGVGAAVCGNSAISATAPIIRARDEDVSFAIATNTLFGTIAVFLYPMLGHLLGLSDSSFGTWAGSAVNDTSQVVASGFAFSERAGEVATAVKLTRNAFMGVVIVLCALYYRRADSDDQVTSAPLLSRVRDSVPAFVLGFLVMASLNTLGAIDGTSAVLGLDLAAGLKWTAQFLILVALTGVGLGTRLSSLREIGLRPFYVGLATVVTTSLASSILIRLLGPAGG